VTARGQGSRPAVVAALQWTPATRVRHQRAPDPSPVDASISAANPSGICRDIVPSSVRTSQASAMADPGRGAGSPNHPRCEPAPPSVAPRSSPSRLLSWRRHADDALQLDRPVAGVDGQAPVEVVALDRAITAPKLQTTLEALHLDRPVRLGEEVALLGIVATRRTSGRCSPLRSSTPRYRARASTRMRLPSCEAVTLMLSTISFDEPAFSISTTTSERSPPRTSIAPLKVTSSSSTTPSTVKRFSSRRCTRPR